MASSSDLHSAEKEESSKWSSRHSCARMLPGCTLLQNLYAAAARGEEGGGNVSVRDTSKCAGVQEQEEEEVKHGVGVGHSQANPHAAFAHTPPPHLTW